jgi:hypothetical protein
LFFWTRLTAWPFTASDWILVLAQVTKGIITMCKGRKKKNNKPDKEWKNYKNALAIAC